MLLLYFAYHSSLRKASGGTSSKREAEMLVVEDVQCWWSKTGIKIKSPHGILYMIDRLVKVYINLEKSKKREGKKDKINRTVFR